MARFASWVFYLAFLAAVVTFVVPAFGDPGKPQVSPIVQGEVASIHLEHLDVDTRVRGLAPTMLILHVVAMDGTGEAKIALPLAREMTIELTLEPKQYLVAVRAAAVITDIEPQLVALGPLQAACRITVPPRSTRL